jgi:DNA-binding MarR family transcriptional regulator
MEAVMAREMRLRREDIIGMLDISPPELRSLMWLYQNGRVVMSDFADGIDVPLSTATRIVNRLVKKGLAVRYRSELDRRTVEIDLSDTAYEHGQRFRDKRQTALQSILAPLDAAEGETVIALLEKGLRLSGPPEKQSALARRANHTK